MSVQMCNHVETSHASTTVALPSCLSKLFLLSLPTPSFSSLVPPFLPSSSPAILPPSVLSSPPYIPIFSFPPSPSFWRAYCVPLFQRFHRIYSCNSFSFSRSTLTTLFCLRIPRIQTATLLPSTSHRGTCSP